LNNLAGKFRIETCPVVWQVQAATQITHSMFLENLPTSLPPCSRQNAHVTFYSIRNQKYGYLNMRDYNKILSNFRRWAAIPLRLIVGYGFIAHGYSKLVHGPAHFASILHALGVPAPELMAWVTILTEVVGGAAVLIGAFIPLVSIPMAAVLLTAMFTTQLSNGFLAIKLQAVTAAGVQFGAPGYEVDLLYLACLAALVIGGSGPLAISGLVGQRRQERRRAVL
jgi:putative oxidoreductase